MSAPIAVGAAAIIKRRLSGVAFLLVIAVLVALTIAIYQKAFTPIVKVTLKADRIGNQLSAPADVKLRGLVVGEVRAVNSTGNGAIIDLALKPELVKLIPANVEAQLLPKTLFGEKYVLLVIPSAPATQSLKAGDVIPQDRSKTALETERVIDDLMPLLQSLKPAELSMTLNALSTALRDRGDKLGANLARAGAYFKKINPELPTLAIDMQELAAFANSTADAVPDLVRLLDNLSANSRNLVEERQNLNSFLTTTTSFAASADQILRDNETRLISLARDAKPSLELFARYSPEFPCLLKGLALYDPIVSDTFGGLQPGLHITLEMTRDNGGYVPGQEPKYRDSRAPNCSGLPNPTVPNGDTAFDDGYRTRSGQGNGAAANYLAPTGGSAPDTMIKTLAAPVLGVPINEVPDLAALLLTPLAQGHAVGLA